MKAEKDRREVTKIMNEAPSIKRYQRSMPSVRVVNAGVFAKGIADAVTQRAREIAQTQPSRRSEQENLRQAEKEILQPLYCGVLHSKEEETISILCSGLGVKGIRAIEVSAEPHRLVLGITNQASIKSGENTTKYWLLNLTDEIDPASVKATLTNGLLLEIQLGKVANRALGARQAA